MLLLLTGCSSIGVPIRERSEGELRECADYSEISEAVDAESCMSIDGEAEGQMVKGNNAEDPVVEQLESWSNIVISTTIATQERKRAALSIDRTKPVSIEIQRGVLDVLMKCDDAELRAVVRSLVVNQKLIVEYVIASESVNLDLAKWLCGLLHSDVCRKLVIEQCLTPDVSVICAAGIVDERIMDEVVHGVKGSQIRIVLGGDDCIVAGCASTDADHKMINDAVEERKNIRRQQILMDEQMLNCANYARIFGNSGDGVHAAFKFVGYGLTEENGYMRILVTGTERKIVVEAPRDLSINRSGSGCLLEVSGELDDWKYGVVRLKNAVWRVIDLNS